MKVSKEDVIGLLTALEYWIEERDVAVERARWRDDIAGDAQGNNLPAAGNRREIVEPTGVVRVPALHGAVGYQRR